MIILNKICKGRKNRVPRYDVYNDQWPFIGRDTMKKNKLPRRDSTT